MNVLQGLANTINGIMRGDASMQMTTILTGPPSGIRSQAFSVCTTLLLCVLMLALPPRASATAVASSTLSFSNLRLEPAMGSVTLSDPWTLFAFAEALNSPLGEMAQQFDLQTSPGTALADAVVTFAQGHGMASAPNAPPDLIVTGSASSNVNLPGCNLLVGAATGRGEFSNSFMLTGGSGSVSVLFGADIQSSLQAITDACGGRAESDANFSLEVFGVGTPLQFHDEILIGPSATMTRTVSPSLMGTLTLEFGTLYSMLIAVDAEVRAVNAPEPATLVLLLSGCLGLLLTAWMRHRRARVPGHARDVQGP